MLIAIGIVIAVAFLGKAGKKALPPPSGPAGEYSDTGNAGTLTHKFNTPDGSPTFTPNYQSISTQWTLPMQLVGRSSADPSVTAMRAGFRSGQTKPIAGLSAMLGVQTFLNGGYK
jgi:hypothetical protein